MKKLLFCLFILGFFFSSSANPEFHMCNQIHSSDSLSDLLNKISEHNIYENKTVGIAGKLSEQFLRIEKLGKVATNDELFQISREHKNAVVRLYAFQLLKYKGITIPQDIQEQFNNDITEIKTLNGCFGNISKVNELSKGSLIGINQTIQYQIKE